MLFTHLKRIVKLDRMGLRGPNGACDCRSANSEMLNDLSAGLVGGIGAPAHHQNVLPSYEIPRRSFGKLRPAGRPLPIRRGPGDD